MYERIRDTYHTLKQQYPGSLLLIREKAIRNRYYTFGEDASKLSEVCYLMEWEGPDGIPSCAFPHYLADLCIERLVENGISVAIAEPVTDRRGIRDEDITPVRTGRGLVE